MTLLNHIFDDCKFVQQFFLNFIDWFNAVNNSNFITMIEEKLLGIMSRPYDNYMTLFMKYYIYTCKIQNKAIHLSTLVDKLLC